MRDFMVQDYGTEPFVYPGEQKQSLIRYETKHPDDEEDLTEDIHFRYGIDIIY
ncbi:hypothetical protein [Paenibacillus phytohabitans]|uniref:hypothetical protein n=1 Tax=Paenibacillus phytohabitans TaxID=2654978 RepID=UPI00300BD8DC